METMVLALALAGSLLAHHSLTNYDTTNPFRVKGSVVQFHAINPHSILYVEQKDPDGQVHRWAIEGPPAQQFSRRGIAKDVLKPGDLVEVCGYLPKEPIVWQVSNGDATVSPAGRLLNGESIILPGGKQESWGDYGVHKCFAAGFTDQHSR